MARREMSKKLIPLPAEIQEDLRAKHKIPKGFFYHNDAGELYCAVTLKKMPSLYFTTISRLEAGSWKKEYNGTIDLERGIADVSLFRKGNSSKPVAKNSGRVVFRIIIEEALRLKAKRVTLLPVDSRLGGYYAGKFGFRKIKHSSFGKMEISPVKKREKKPLIFRP